MTDDIGRYALMGGGAALLAAAAALAAGAETHERRSIGRVAEALGDGRYLEDAEAFKRHIGVDRFRNVTIAHTLEDAARTKGFAGQDLRGNAGCAQPRFLENSRTGQRVFVGGDVYAPYIPGTRKVNGAVMLHELGHLLSAARDPYWSRRVNSPTMWEGAKDFVVGGLWPDRTPQMREEIRAFDLGKVLPHDPLRNRVLDAHRAHLRGRFLKALAGAGGLAGAAALLYGGWKSLSEA